MTGPPFFIVGADRSGTTLLRFMLARHPELAIPPEGHFIPFLWSRRRRYGEGDRIDRPEQLLRDLGSHQAFRFWGLPIDAVRTELSIPEGPSSFADAIGAIYGAYARSHQKSRWGDKTPRYVDHVPLLGELFPDARFVHMIRDGRDVALSMIGLNRLHRKAASAGYIWARKIRSGLRGASTVGSARFLDFRYEDLLEDPEKELRRLCAFLALDFDAAMLVHDERDVDRVPAPMRRMHTRLALPPTKGLRDWRLQMEGSEVEEFEAVAGRELALAGYELHSSPARPGAKVSAWARVAAFAVRVARHRVRRAVRSAPPGL